MSVAGRLSNVPKCSEMFLVSSRGANHHFRPRPRRCFRRSFKWRSGAQRERRRNHRPVQISAPVRMCGTGSVAQVKLVPLEQSYALSLRAARWLREGASGGTRMRRAAIATRMQKGAGTTRRPAIIYHWQLDEYGGQSILSIIYLFIVLCANFLHEETRRGESDDRSGRYQRSRSASRRSGGEIIASGLGIFKSCDKSITTSIACARQLN